MAKKLTDEERAVRDAAKKEAAAKKAEEKKLAAAKKAADDISNMPEDWQERNKLTVEERASVDAAAKKAAELQKQRLEVIPPKVKTAKRFSKVPPTDKDELLADYNNIQRAMANDTVALAAVEAKYGKINNPGDLTVLSTNLYARITGNEKNVADTQAEIEGRHAAHSKK